MGSPDENKFRIALAAGLFSPRPAREILLRLATHILKGNQIGHPPILKLLDNAILHFIPGVDVEFDDAEESKDCNSAFRDEASEKLLQDKDTPKPIIINAFKRLLQIENYDVVVILGGGASQIRCEKCDDILI